MASNEIIWIDILALFKKGFPCWVGVCAEACSMRLGIVVASRVFLSTVYDNTFGTGTCFLSHTVRIFLSPLLSLYFLQSSLKMFFSLRRSNYPCGTYFRRWLGLCRFSVEIKWIQLAISPVAIFFGLLAMLLTCTKKSSNRAEVMSHLTTYAMYPTL